MRNSFLDVLVLLKTHYILIQRNKKMEIEA